MPVHIKCKETEALLIKKSETHQIFTEQTKYNFLCDRFYFPHSKYSMFFGGVFSIGDVFIDIGRIIAISFFVLNCLI